MGAVLLAVIFAGSARADEYDTLRLKWKDTIVGSGYDPADTDVASRLNSIASSASNYWSSMNKTPARTNLWSDAASTTVSADITTCYSRLRAMALAYATTNCSLQGNASLLADISGGLDWMYTNRYNATSSQYDNWWDWEIGSPLQLTDLCVLLYDQLTATQRTNYMNAVEHQTPTPDMTQANKVWKARAVGVRGCVVKSATKIALCRDAFSAVFPYVTSGDGYYTDGSFIQHDYHPYTAGYGASLIATMAPILNWLNGSTWEITDPAQANLFHWVFDSYEPIIYRGNTFDLVRGREAGRSNASPNSNGMMDSILQIAQFAPAADAARMKSMIKEWALADTTRNFVSGRGLPTLMLAKNLMNDATIVRRGELMAHYTFAEMDRVIHLGAGYGFGLTMCSTRVANFESINGENLRGWLTGDGQTTLYNSDLNAFADSYWATVDHYRLPGVTADVTLSRLPAVSAAIGPRAQGQSTRSTHNWVGGATLGNYGAAGMQFKGVDVTLTGKKSWFMFDNEIVCLGAGITSTDNRPIETTVENRKLLTTGDNAFTVNDIAKPKTPGWAETMTNVNWAHLAGNVTGSDIGYYFPQASTLKAVREARTGAWSDIDDGSSTNAITRNFLRFGFDHGSKPTNATYQYVLLPGLTARRMSQYATQPHVSVIANNTNVQAVTENTLGITAANFWNNTSQTAGLITANKKCSVLVQNDGTFIDVAVSDPTQTNTGTITIQLAASANSVVSTDSAITVTQTTPSIALTVNVSGAQGKTFKARFYVGTPQIVNIAAEADAYVQDGTNTTANFGTATFLTIKKGTAGYNRESYLRFNVPAWDGLLIGASLNLMPTTAQVPGVHGIAVVNDNTWSETGITWSNKPASSASVLSTWTPASNSLVSANVLSAITTSGQVSFRVYSTTQTSDGFVNYGSRENGTTTNRPQLALSIGHAPPTVTITSPTDGDYIKHAGPLLLAADATPADGAITNVAFYDGATLLGADTTSPYTITANLAGGTHLLTAIATDANGLTRTSLVRRIDVAYPPTAPSATLNTPRNTSIDIDLRTLASDVETPAANLRFTLGAATHGIVALLADGHTARFTPSLGYTGPATFAYTVTDTSNDDRLLLNYDFQSSDATDATGQGRDGAINLQGTGTAAYTNDFPASLAPYHTQSLHLNENGTNGAGRVERTLAATEVDFPNANWTIAGWFKRSTANNNDTIVQLGDSGGYANSALTLGFYGTGTTLQLLNYNVTVNDVNISKTSVTTGAWHHFAIVRSGTALSLYLDGTFGGSNSAFGFTFDNSKPVKFGGVTTSVLDRWLNGSLADLAVFNAAISSTEVLKLTTMPVSYFGGQSASNSIAVNILTPMETWRLASLGTITNIGSAADMADPDGDGRNNLAEYIAGTNPTNTDAPSALSVTNFSKKFVVRFTANAASGTGYTGLNRYFDLLSSTNSVAGLWTGVLNYTNIIGNNQVVAYTNASTASSTFYKLQIRIQ